MRLGFPETLWDEIQGASRSADPLESDTVFYNDMYVAIRVFGMLYTDYMQRTTLYDRLAYKLFLVLEGAKEKYHREKEERHRDAQRAAEAAVPKSRGR